ncbi:MAG: hypothetical protein ACJAV4_000329, partial [Pontimonas sp.]
MTATPGIRKDRPNRIAGISPERTMRHTVTAEKRIIRATSVTV